MATTNKSSKAKTKKPIKKTTVKSTKKTKSSKSTSSTAKVSVKAVTKNVKKLKTVNPISNVLTRLNILSALIAAGLAVAAGMLMDSTKFELVTGLVAKNNLAKGSGDTFVPAVYHIYDLELKWAVVAILVLSAILPILLVTVYKNRYAEALKSKVHTLRWIDMALISSLMIWVVALLSGVQDLPTLKVISSLVVVTCLLGWISEKRASQAGRVVWSEVVVGVITGTLPWIIIASYAIGTYVFGNITNNLFVYVAYAGVGLGFISYCMNHINSLRKHKTWAIYEVVERNYIVIGILTKLVFALALIVGLQK